ncbi:MAG TPA: nitroreductase family protein [Dehalococcoidia bacterium]|nr:nitroreductase family protein [Dehalococcoidia bacterium]
MTQQHEGGATTTGEREPGIFEVIYSARAMRRLRADQVPEELLLRLIEAAIQAPTPSNIQGWRWLIVRDAEQKERLAALNREAVLTYLERGSRLISPQSPAEAEQAERNRRALQWQADHLQEAPALIVACTDADPAMTPNSRRAAGAIVIWPAIQNLLLAARALGLGATPTTLALSDRDAFRAVLDLPDEIEAHCLIPVGYPLGRFGPVSRPPVFELLRWDRWS